jgi:outer membrane protein
VVKRFFKFILSGALVFFSSVALAWESEALAEQDEQEAYWDYGFGVGGVRYQQYPASNEFSYLVIPTPTFQYRGKVLRADDRDGAHLYLFKGNKLTVELAGEGYPALESSNSNARAGMEDLPWLIALGPELVWRGVEDFEFGLGIYQATSTDFSMTRFAGQIFEARATYQFGFPFESYGPFTQPGFSNAKVTLSLQGGSKEFQAIYFGVPTEDATPDRTAYEAQAGFLDYALTYYQTFKSGLFSINYGMTVHNYDMAANRDSSLHRSDHNVTGFIGLNYVLGQSSKPAVPENETSGVINSIRTNRNLRNSL